MIGQVAKSLFSQGSKIFNYAKPIGQELLNKATSSRFVQGAKNYVSSVPGGQTGLRVLGAAGRTAANVAPQIPGAAANVAGFGLGSGFFGPMGQRLAPMLMNRFGVTPNAGFRRGAMAAATVIPVGAGVLSARRQLGQINDPVVYGSQSQQNYMGQ